MEIKDINLVEDGYVAVIDKPLEWTSADVVRKVKFKLQRMGYRKIKVGHAGTLDNRLQKYSRGATRTLGWHKLFRGR